jgi:ATP-dependent Clp protease ATP-binding subunit ClpB
LERRFQPVFVDEPSVEDTISILRGLRDRYETHHKVRILDSALVAAAMLANRYITDRFLPDKAIDLVDEAASKLRMEMTSLPVELDETERRIMQLEIEREALRKEKDAASRERLENLEKELADLKEKRDALRSRWEGERETLQRVRRPARADRPDQGRDRAGEPRLRLEPRRRAAVRHPGAARAATARGGAAEAAAQDGRLLKEEVDGEDIAGSSPLDRCAGQPAGRRRDREADEDGGSAARAGDRQDEAITAVANAIVAPARAF